MIKHVQSTNLYINFLQKYGSMEPGIHGSKEPGI